jgi:hypothetical protein
MALAKLKSVPDPLRQALVDALAELKTAKKQVDNHNAAVRKCWAALREAEAVAARAEQGIAASRIEAAGVLASTLVDADDVVAPPNTVALARAAHADALESIENLKAARDQLRRELPDLEDDARTAAAAVKAAAAAVIVPDVEALLAKAKEIWSTLAPLKRALEQAAVTDSGPQGTWQEIVAASNVAKPLAPVRAEIEQFLRECSNRSYRQAGPNPFVVARERLLQDPHASIDDLMALPASAPPPPAA